MWYLSTYVRQVNVTAGNIPFSLKHTHNESSFYRGQNTIKENRPLKKYIKDKQ